VDIECDVFMDKGYLDKFENIEVSATESEGDLNYDFARYLNKNFAGKVSPSLFKKRYQPH